MKNILLTALLLFFSLLLLTTLSLVSAKEEKEKYIALTFDDGPNGEMTNYLLEELKKREAHVTFFLLGSKIKGNEKIIEKMVEEHHSIGSHTQNHKILTTLKEEEILKEITESNQIIGQITKKEVTLLRPPYGSYNTFIQNSFPGALILWNVDTNDWKVKNVRKVADTIINTAKDGDIILLHDLYKTSIESALIAIDEMTKKGYNFVSIEELSEIKNHTLKSHQVYHFIR